MIRLIWCWTLQNLKIECKYMYVDVDRDSLYGFDKQGYFPTFTAVNMEPYWRVFTTPALIQKPYYSYAQWLYLAFLCKSIFCMLSQFLIDKANELIEEMLSSKCMAELGWRQFFILFKFTNLTQCFKIITWKFYLVSTNLHNVWPSDIVQSQNGPKLKLARTQAKCTEGPFWTQLQYTEGPFWTKLECTKGPFWLFKAVWA